MPENVFGLPTHIALLHIVVVLLPIAAAATIAVVVSSWFRHRFGLFVLGATFLTALVVPVTSQSGEGLAKRLPDAPEIQQHAAVGQQLVIWAAVFGLCLAAVVALDLVRRATVPADERTRAESWAIARLSAGWRTTTPSWADTAFRIFQVLAVLASIGVLVMVIRAGHTGAQAVWSQYPDLQPA